MSEWDRLPEDLQWIIRRQAQVLHGQDKKAAHRAQVQSLRKTFAKRMGDVKHLNNQFEAGTRQMILENKALDWWSDTVRISSKLNQHHIATLMQIKDLHALAVQEVLQARETLNNMGRRLSHQSYWNACHLDPTPLHLRQWFLYQMDRVIAVP